MRDCPSYLSRLAVGAVLAAAFLSAGSGSAFAAFTHSTVEKTFSAGPDCDEVVDIALVESTGTIYVACAGAGGASGTIRKFDLEGNPVAFSSSKPHIEGNTIVENPDNGFGEGHFGPSPRIAVDNSSAHDGFIYVVGGDSGWAYGADSLVVFAPSGDLATSISPTGIFEGSMEDVDVGPDGSAYVIQGGGVPAEGPSPDHVTKYSPLFKEVLRLYPGIGGSFVRVDSQDSLWTMHSEPGLGIRKYESDQLSANVSISPKSSQAAVKSVLASPSPLFPSPVLAAADLRNFDIDLSDDDLYVNRGNRIETYSGGSASEPPHRNAPIFGEGALTGSRAIAVTADHRVFASTAGSTVVRFGPGGVVPDVHTPPPAIDDIGHTTATVRAHLDLDGGTEITSCQVAYGKTPALSGPGSGVAACAPDPGASPPVSHFATATDVSSSISGLETGQQYFYRFKAGNSTGENGGLTRTITPAFVIGVKTLPADTVDLDGATLNGSLDPDGTATTFHFEYGVDDKYGLETPEEPAGIAAGVVAVEAELNGLQSGRTFHYRLVATNSAGTTHGPDETVKIADRPGIAGVRATEVDVDSAVLNARIDGNGYQTTYRWEYGPTPEYGSTVLATEPELGGVAPQQVSQPIAGLHPGVTYHFRIVAGNKWGEVSSPDTTFDFAPPACPNNHIRQQTRSNYLPDCRAYELVSPGNAGAVQLFPSQIAFDDGTNNWPLNSGFVGGPSRFSYFGVLGTVDGLNAPNAELDMYVATRTAGGWVTSLPGLEGSEAIFVGRRQCSALLDSCIDHSLGNTPAPEAAPYLFTVAGDPLGRLPTNLAEVPGGERFFGAQRMSRDFGHFAFSSGEIWSFSGTSPGVAFTPDGIPTGLGSAYDNDIAASTVKLISRLPGGGHIPQDGPSSSAQRIEFPGLSADGSHVLMQTPASSGPHHLYMRAAGLTYDVSRGAGVDFVGMTSDGGEVYFVAEQQLTADDTDTSADLYAWREQGDTLVRLSRGNSQGDTDACLPSTWTEACSVAPLAPERANPHGQHSIEGLDDVIAEQSGDVYFYSPELLDGGKGGVAGLRNLYVYRDGAVELVTTLDEGTEIDRMQISADGRHAAFVTASRLTSYDNDGRKTMYAYDAVSRTIRCVSCDPSGLPPSSDVMASQGGRFMADDGRAFFATRDSLDPRDSNNGIIDVYEYVDGRPQLISTGTGSRDSTGSTAVISLAFPPEDIGLEAVSRDGLDVYFSTFETLVSQDQNGGFVKFYNARTGGGFPPISSLAPCAAADECHGPDSSPPTLPGLATSTDLGNGNAPAVGKKRKKARRKKARRGKAKRGAGRNGGRHG
jgi:hypothetical protein